jgi:integrase
MPSINLTAVFVEKVKPQGKRTDYFDFSLPGFSLRLTEKGVKTWCVSYRFVGKWTRYTFATFPIIKLAEARQMAADALHDVAHGINPATKKKVERNSETFDYLAKEYLERHAKPNKKSWEEDERIINRDLLPVFGGTRAKDITRRDVRTLLDRKAITAPIMANRIRATLRKMFNWAILNEIVETNPVHLVPLPAKDRRRDRILSEDEIKAVWNALDKEVSQTRISHRKRQAITAASLKLRLITAQRGGEVMSMEWSEIDDDWWTIPGGKTKNGLTHRVPLTPFALRVLEEMRTLAEETGNKKRPLSQYVFPSPKTYAPMANPQKALERIHAATGIQFRGHDLRRTAASMMTGMGIPRLTVSKILNHVEPGVTAVYDRHSYDKEKRQALAEWSKRLSLIVSYLREVKSEG